MNRKYLTTEWLKGFHLCWRILALLILVRMVLTVGFMTSIMIIGAIGNEGYLLPLFIVFGLIAFIFIPILVSSASEWVHLGTTKKETLERKG